MILFEEALEIIKKVAVPLPGETVSLGKSAGRILFEDVFSDMDMPVAGLTSTQRSGCSKLFRQGRCPVKLSELVNAQS